MVLKSLKFNISDSFVCLKNVVMVIFVLSINLSYGYQKYANKTYIDNVVKTFGLAR